MNNDKLKRVFFCLLAFFLMALSYLFQDYFSTPSILGFKLSAEMQFILKKIVRIVINDSAALLLIHAWFLSRKINRLALIIQIFDIFILLPLYITLKFMFEGTSEISMPLLSQLHRLTVNPILMILLIPAIYFQRIYSDQK